MRLIKPSFEIISKIDGEEILKQIELAARTCYKSEDKIEYASGDVYHLGAHNYVSSTEFVLNKHNKELVYSGRFTMSDLLTNNLLKEGGAISARKLISKLITNGHEAMLEFGGNITVKFICDRGVSHELVRHRVASFAQESTRYCNYGKNEHMQFIIPSWLDYIPELETNHPIKLNELIPERIISKGDRDCVDMGFKWAMNMLRDQNAYFDFITFGNWSPQQARSVLPNSLKTEINVSANIREWRHILKLRVASGAHPQMRELMCPLLDTFKRDIPILFDDINY